VLDDGLDGTARKSADPQAARLAGFEELFQVGPQGISVIKSLAAGIDDLSQSEAGTSASAARLRVRQRR
jgi:hypothetical protein